MVSRHWHFNRCSFLLLSWKGAQNVAHCNCIVCFFFLSCRAEYYWEWGRSFCSGIFIQQCFVYSITTWKNTYLKNSSKTFHALISTPYNYPKQTTCCTYGYHIDQIYTVVCNMPFLFSWLWIYLEKKINYVFKVWLWTKHDFAVLQTLGVHKFQLWQAGLKSQHFSMWLEAN